MFVLNSLIILGFAALWWHQSSRRHDLIRQRLRSWCKGRGFTLIDDTVVWRGFKRRQPGQWLWYWVYDFEVSHDGLQRTGGQVFLETGAIERIWLSIGQGENQLYEALHE